MRISDDARDCSVFLGWKRVGGHEADLDPEGTGFLVTIGEAREFGIYLITAGHVAEALGSDPFQIRHNKKHGQGADLDYVDNAKWLFHPDYPNVDVAALQYVPPTWANSVVFPTSAFVDEDRIREWNIGTGDLVQIIGLFHLHSGNRRNLPVAHTGNIALEPSDEKIPIDLGSNTRAEVEGYLVEISGLEGSSGSPAYVRATASYLQNDQKDRPTLMHAYCRVFCLGVWVGAWSGEPDSVLAAKARGAMVPVGMGVVIPAMRIMEVLNMPKEKERRKKKLDEFIAGRSARPLSLGKGAITQRSSAQSEPPKADNPAHKEDFTALLGEAAQSPAKGG